jgi:hypothetical protein
LLTAAPPGSARHLLWTEEQLADPTFQRSLQRLYLGAAVNLKRIATLAEIKDIDLRAILTNLSQQQL